MFKFRTKKMQNQKRGLIAKKSGDGFEAFIKAACYTRGWGMIEIPSGCEWVSAHKARPVKTPFDFVLVKQGICVFGDAKTSLANSFSYSMVDPNQKKWLAYTESFGHISGYLVNFRTLEQTVFFSAKQLSSLRPRQSLKPDNGLLLGDNNGIHLDRFYELLQKTSTTTRSSND